MGVDHDTASTSTPVPAPGDEGDDAWDEGCGEEGEEEDEGEPDPVVNPKEPNMLLLFAFHNSRFVVVDLGRSLGCTCPSGPIR